MEESEQKAGSFPRFISNAPLGNDLFEGKSQERVASNIAEIIINNDDCKVIGIDGAWGFWQI